MGDASKHVLLYAKLFPDVRISVPRKRNTFVSPRGVGTGNGTGGGWGGGTGFSYGDGYGHGQHLGVRPRLGGGGEDD
jgi:hypothetical protein